MRGLGRHYPHLGSHRSLPECPPADWTAIPPPAKVGACSNIASDRRPPSRFPVPWRGKLPAQIQPRFYDLRECFLDNYGLFNPIKLPIPFLATILTLVGERGGRMPCQGRIWRYLHPALQLKGAGPTEH